MSFGRASRRKTGLRHGQALQRLGIRERSTALQLIHPRGEEALACLRAMRTVTAGDGPIPTAVRAMMMAAQRALMALDVDVDALQPTAPAELAQKVQTPGMADQLVGAFTAGFKRTNPFCMILLVSFLWGSGINVVPVPQPHITGSLGRNDNAAKFIHAIERGSRVNTDLADNWDFWPMLPLPLEEARARLNITP